MSGRCGRGGALGRPDIAVFMGPRDEPEDDGDKWRGERTRLSRLDLSPESRFSGEERGGRWDLPPQVHPVQRVPKPEGLALAAEADGDLEVGTVDGAISGFGLSIADIKGVEVPLPAIARAYLDALDLIG
jgi:hypothetical protein